MASPGSSPSNYAGLPWSVWAEKVPLSPENVLEDQKDTGKSNQMKSDLIHRSDKSLYGTCPSQDEFYLVICEKCGQVIKPQALQNHIAKHLGEQVSPSHRPIQPFTADTLAPKSCVLTKASVKEKTSWSFNTSPRYRDKYDLIKGSRTRKNCRVGLENLDVTGKQSLVVSDGSAETIVNGALLSQDTLLLSDSSQGDISDAKVNYTNGVAVLSAGSPGLPRLSEPDRLSPVVAEKISVSDVRTTPPLIVRQRDDRVSLTGHGGDSQLNTHSLSQIPPKPPDILMCGDTRPVVPTRNRSGSEDFVATSPFDDAPHVLTSVDTIVEERTVVAPEMPPLLPMQYVIAAPVIATEPPATKKLPLRDSKSIPCKYREYDCERHCGVAMDDGLQCTRSLTCKSHSLSSKRAVPNRRSYDDLLQSHRDEKEAALRAKLEARAKASGKDAALIQLTAIKTQSAAIKNHKSVVSKAASCAAQSRPPLSHLQTPPSVVRDHDRLLLDGSSRLSSDGEGDNDTKDDLPYVNHHPRPAAVCTFGARRTCQGSFIFGRKSDFLRAAFMSAVERHLHPPPHKKLCVEAKLPVEQNNSKDPYEFNSVDSMLLSHAVFHNPVAFQNPAVVLNPAHRGVMPKPKLKVAAPNNKNNVKCDRLKPSYVVTMPTTTTVVTSPCTTTVSTVASATAKRKRLVNTALLNSPNAIGGNPLSTALVANFTLSANSGAPIFAIPNLSLGNATIASLTQSKMTTAGVPAHKTNLLKDIGFVVTGRDATSLNGAYVNVSSVDNARLYKTQIVLDDKQFMMDAAKQFTIDQSKPLTIDPAKFNLDPSRQYTIDANCLGLDAPKQFLLDPVKINVDSPKAVAIDPIKLNIDVTSSSSKHFTVDSKQFALDPAKFNLDSLKQFKFDTLAQNESASTANNVILPHRTNSYVTIGENAFILDSSGSIPVTTILTANQLCGSNRSTLVLQQAPKLSSMITLTASSPTITPNTPSSLSTSFHHTNATIVPRMSSPHCGPNGLVATQPTVSIKAFPVAPLNHIHRVGAAASPSGHQAPNLGLMRLEPNQIRKPHGRGTRAPRSSHKLQAPQATLMAANASSHSLSNLRFSCLKQNTIGINAKNSAVLAKPSASSLSLYPLITGPINQSQSLTHVLGQAQSLAQAVLVSGDDLKAATNSQPQPNVIT